MLRAEIWYPGWEARRILRTEDLLMLHRPSSQPEIIRFCLLFIQRLFPARWGRIQTSPIIHWVERDKYLVWRTEYQNCLILQFNIMSSAFEEEKNAHDYHGNNTKFLKYIYNMTLTIDIISKYCFKDVAFKRNKVCFRISNI